MCVSRQTIGELARDQLESSRPELGMIHGGQRVVYRTFQRSPRLDDDVVGRLLGDLPQDDGGLRVEGGDGAVLVIEDQTRRAERGSDGEHHRQRAARAESYPMDSANLSRDPADGRRQTGTNYW